MLQVRELAVEVGGNVILDGASFSIRARDKVGLVGRNGAGKTSLLKVLGGASDPYAGVVHRSGGLGLDGDRLDQPVGSLSGGQKRRVEIARILFAGSDVLLLDEPTNHLDSDAKDWLLDFMRAYKGALLVISHDLDLLDEAITRVLHLDRYDDASLGSMEEYKGTYTEYLANRAKDEVRLAKA